MAAGDSDIELIDNEIDWARLVKMILLELRNQKPLPNSDKFWISKGFDIKKRPMSLTLNVLHNFLETVTGSVEMSTDSVPREDKIRVDKSNVRNVFKPPTLIDVQTYCAERNNSIDAERFINYYETRGWKVGKFKMEDWKAAVRTWENNNKKEPEITHSKKWED